MGSRPLTSSWCWAPRCRPRSIPGVSHANRDGRSNGLRASAGVLISLALNFKTWGGAREWPDELCCFENAHGRAG
jgi:hypothetical protein